ncbi:hypothetical protein Sinac_1417 [Singulisphaera acidiphila DSM 18658]|uniref:Uncharacterized protein n=1 Tax=Singulisphaera acidiphila (strain ATCC BAA-1392 / DSM 18658 / VKM B-2454 / MOB10) TaxID=886293 RepID=L0DAB8_SINAD|nr:hypothetical protein Sinac_1417 [Singulisphaera acidiphila DSM 18658]
MKEAPLMIPSASAREDLEVAPSLAEAAGLPG